VRQALTVWLVSATGAHTSYETFDSVRREAIMEEETKDVLAQITDLEKEFIKEHGRRPTKLHMTREKELEFSDLPASRVGDENAGKTVQELPSKLFPKIHDMEVVWDAEEFKVE